MKIRGTSQYMAFSNALGRVTFQGLGGRVCPECGYVTDGRLHQTCMKCEDALPQVATMQLLACNPVGEITAEAVITQVDIIKSNNRRFLN